MPGEELRDRNRTTRRQHDDPGRVLSGGLEMGHADRRDRRGDGSHFTVGQHGHVDDPERGQRGDRPAGGRAEADHCGPDAPPVRPGRAQQLQGMQH